MDYSPTACVFSGISGTGACYVGDRIGGEIVAEFSDVIHTIQRICKRKKGKCSTCLLGEFACPNNARFDKTEETAFCELEDVVVKWAEENPEPTTVYEWLVSLGLLSADMWSISDLHKPIPADIAQKLGIEPKEG